MINKNKKTKKDNLPLALNLQIKPEEAIKQGKGTILTLKKVLNTKTNPVIIKGKRYIEYGDWITLGNFYGITVKTHDAEPVTIFGNKGFKARAALIRVDDGTVIGGAEAYCLENERNWKNKDLFQLASMAQTRAGSKALSNALRWVVELEKTLSGTPAEEMVKNQPTKKIYTNTSDKTSIISSPSKNYQKPSTNQKRENPNTNSISSEFKKKGKTPDKIGNVVAGEALQRTDEIVDVVASDALETIKNNLRDDKEFISKENVLKKLESMLEDGLIKTEMKNRIEALL